MGATETYAPVRVDGRQIAVARVRRDLAVMVAPARRMLTRLVLLGALVAAAVFGSLWLLVRRADRLLKRQHVELEEARSQLEARSRLLEELNRRKDDFYAMVSDDLHAPLLAVRDGLQLVLAEGKEGFNPFQREVLSENPLHRGRGRSGRKPAGPVANRLGGRGDSRRARGPRVGRELVEKFLAAN